MKDENYGFKSIVAAVLLLGILTMFITYVEFDMDDMSAVISDSIAGVVGLGSDESGFAGEIFSDILMESFEDELPDGRTMVYQNGIEVCVDAMSIEDPELEHIGVYVAVSLIGAWSLALLAIVFCFLFRGKSGYIATIVLSSVSLLLMGAVYMILPSLLTDVVETQVSQQFFDDDVLGLSKLAGNAVDGVVSVIARSVVHHMISYGFYCFLIICLVAIVLSAFGIVLEKNEASDEQAYLLGLTGEFSGANLNIGSGIVIGRDPAQCQLILRGEHVSRKHCKVIFDETSGKYVVTDYSSTGVYLENGQKLSHDSPVMLDRGTVIMIGKCGDRFELR